MHFPRVYLHDHTERDEQRAAIEGDGCGLHAFAGVGTESGLVLMIIRRGVTRMHADTVATIP
jgi:hypothetical protein